MGVFGAGPGTELLTTSDRPAAHPGAAISHLGSLRCPPCPCFSKSTPCNHGAQPASCSPEIGPVSAAKAGIPDTRTLAGTGSMLALPVCPGAAGARLQAVASVSVPKMHWCSHLGVEEPTGKGISRQIPASTSLDLGQEFAVLEGSRWCLCPFVHFWETASSRLPSAPHRCCTRDQERWWGAAWPGAGSGVGTVTRQDLGWGRTLSHLQCERTV